MTKHNRNRLVDTEISGDGYQRGRRLGGCVGKVKGLRSTNWQLQNSHGDVKYSVGYIVNNIVMTTYGVRRVLEILGGTCCKVYCCLTTMLYT